MSTPNRLPLAQSVAAQRPELVRQNTSEACGQLVEFIAKALHADDPDWGLLSKSAGEHQYNGHAIDAVIYKRTQHVIDLMSGAGDRDPDSGVPADQQHDIRVKWDEVPKRPGNEWLDPGGVTPPDDPPPPPDNTIDELKRELAAVRAELVAMRTEVNAARGQAIAASGSVAILRADFDNYTAHPPLPTDVVKRGDPVQVRGSIGLAAALSGSKVTWNGVIGELPKGTVSVSKSGRG